MERKVKIESKIRINLRAGISEMSRSSKLKKNYRNLPMLKMHIMPWLIGNKSGKTFSHNAMPVRTNSIEYIITNICDQNNLWYA